MKKSINKSNTAVFRDDRFYTIDGKDYPRVTMILDSWSKGKEFYKWLQQNGLESEGIKNAAASKGTMVHELVTALIKGEELRIDNFDIEVWDKLCDFVNWYKALIPTILHNELTLHSKKYKYAGTADLVVKLGADTVLVDLKTGKGLYPSYWAQLAAYASAYEEMKLGKITHYALLHVGTRHKIGYNFVIEPVGKTHFDEFLACKRLFDAEHGDMKPNHKEFPTTIKL